MTLEVENAFGAAKAGGLFRDMNMVYNFKKMKNRNEYGKIYRNPLFKRLAVLMVLLFCVEGAWGGVYEWTGATGDSSWTTPGNWKKNGSDATTYPGNNKNSENDDVVVKTASAAVRIVIPENIQIHGFITYGQNTCTIFSENASFNVDVMLIGSSANWYRTDNSRLPNVKTNYVPDSDENRRGSLKFDGSTTVNIEMIDTSSWTEAYDKKNELSVSYGSSVNITTWETGTNTQEFKDENGNIIGTNTNRVKLEIEGNVVSGTVTGEAKDELKSEIKSNPNVVNIDENTFIWTGDADDGKWSTAGNWKNNVVPNANTAEVLIKGKASSITIESAESFTVKTLNFSDNPSLKISGTLTIEENLGSAFNIIDSESAGKLIVAKNIIPSKNFESTTLEIECLNLEIAKNFKTKSLNSTGTVTFIGGENQTFNVNGVTLPYVVISKSGGKVTFSGTASFTNFKEISTGCDYFFDGPVAFTNMPNSGKGFITTGIVHITGNCNLFSANGDLSFSGNLVDEGTWSENGTITFNGTGDQTFIPKAGTTYPKIQVNKTGGKLIVESALKADSFTIAKGTVVLSKQATVTNFANNGSVEITGGDTVIPVSGAFSGTGTIKLLNGKVKLTSTESSLQSEIILEKADVTIAGNFSVTDFIATTNMNGKSVTLNNSKITVSGTLALEGGSSADDELYVSGFSGDGFIVTENKTGGNYLKIDPNIAIFDNSDSVGVFTYSGSNSIPAKGITDEHYAAVIRNGWNIKDKKLLTYRWKTDSTDSEWTKASNWDLEIVPVNDATVIIQAPVNAETKSSPVVSSAVSVGNLAIESRAKITLSDSANLTLSGKAGNGDAAEKISNEGTIVYKSSGRITDGSNAINDFDSGTVEYSTGSGSVTEMGTSDYFNLVISSGTWSCENTVTAKNLSISGGTISGTFSAENGINITGTVLASGNVTFSNNVTNTGTLTAGTGPLTFSGDYDGASGTLNGKDGASSGDSITFEGNVTFGNFKHNDEKVSFSISDDKSLITNNQLFASADFKSTVTGKKISVTGLLRVQENISNNNVLDENVNLEISGSQTTEITGIKKVNKLTINNTSTSQTKTIKFPSGSGNKITVSDEFYVTGKNLSDDGKNLILTTSVSGDADNESTWWYIDAKVDKSSVENAEIRYAFSENDISSKLTSCVEGPDGDYTTYNWFSEHKYYWFGNENSSWSNKGNWSTSSDSFNPASKAPRITDSSSVIEIIKDGTEAGTNLLVLAEDVTVKSFTVNESQKVQLAGKSVTGNEIENNGIIIIDGTKGIPLNAANIFHNSSSTIEFSGWTSGNVVQTTYDGLGLPEVQESKGFKNLIVSGNGKDFVFTSGSDLVVLGTFFTDVSKISTGSKKQTYSGKVTLGSDTTFSGSEITFGNELNSDTAKTHDVTIIGNATFMGAVGTTSFNSLSVSGTSALNGGSVTTKETQSYTGAVTLGKTTTFTGSDITFENELNSDTADNYDVTISGNAIFTGAVGTTSFNSLAVTGTSAVNGGSITTKETQTYTDAITLGNAAIFTGSTITFSNEVTGGKDLTISGDVSFGNNVTASKVSVSGTTDVGGNVTTTGGTQSYTGAVTVKEDTTFTGSDINFGNELNSDTAETHDVTITGNATFTGAVGSTSFNSITIAGTPLVNGGSVSTKDTQTYTGIVTLGNAATFTGSIITFSNEVTGGKDLTISGDVSFENNVTASKVSVSGTTDVSGNITTTGGTQSYTGDVTIKTDITFTGSEITFENELNSDTAETHDVTIIGNATFTGTVGNTSFYSLSVIGTSAVNGGSITTKETQSYTGVVTLGNAATFTGSTITFSNEVTGGKDLILDASLTEFYDKVSAENFVLYGGTVNLNADLSTIRDVVLLGKNYSTHVEHLYTKRRRKNHNFMAALKSASLISRDGIINIDGGHEINVGENFYANTVTLKGNQKWSLCAKNNSDSDVCFIEAYNSIIENSRVKGTVPSKVTKGMAEGCTDNGENTDWDFDDFVIVEANTVTDSVIRIKFNKPVRNLHEEFSSLVSKIHYDSGTKNFANIYKDYSFNSGAWNVSAIGTSEPDVVYIETLQSRWNTDANGTVSGHVSSTDSFGKQHGFRNGNVIPNLNFERNVKSESSAFGIVFTDQFGKILKQSGTIYDIVSDGASPVLVKVTTGQENHTRYKESTGALSQRSYDAHNFIEFVYSEPVDFDNTSNSGTLTLSASQTKFENVQVQDSLGAITESNGKLTVAGLATFNGALSAGDRRTGESSSTVHSLYIKPDMNSHTVRISIAGLVDGTITDNDGNEYKNWIGYIDNAETPSGQVTLPRQTNGAYIKCPVFDRADQASENPHPVRNRIQSVKTDGLSVSGALWDVIKPSFAIYRKSAAAWNSDLLKGHFEAIGSTVDGTSSLKRIEFHMFDNTPTYDENDSAYWVSRKGWVSSISVDANLVSTDSENGTFAADDFGGSRMFKSNRTSGGIRYSSIVDSAGAFKHITGDDFSMSPDNVFDETKKAYFNVTSPIFIATEGAVRTPNYADSPYFGLTLKETIPSLKTTFIVSYDDTKGFVTDLAGNRLESARIRTIDTTPPSFVMSLAPVGQKKLYLMFAKRLNFDDTVNLKNLDSGESVNKKLLEFFPESFVLGKIDGTDFVESDLKIDANIKPVVHLGNSSVADNELFNNDYCSVELGLNREVTYDDVLNLYVQCKPLGSKFQDPVTGLHTKVATFVQDDTGVGNYLPAYSAHSLSDFAVNAVNPVYAYNAAFNAPNDASKSGLVQKNLFGENSFGVHDWDAEQKNFGTLLPEDEIHVIASAVSKDAMNARIYLDNSPENGSVSDEYNRISGSSLRVWLPEVPGLNIFKTIATKANPVESYFVTDGKNLENSDVPDGIDFSIPEEAVKLWAPGDQVSFLFGMTENDGTDVRMCHSPVFDYQTEEYIVKKDSPLFALRLKDPADILSLDLWSFRLKEMILQKGGVTILNNVINAGKGEKAVVRVDNPKTGKVDVIVMTLDGNVIEYLHRGELEAGNENYFTWNGKNRNGKAVARGMYFVRVIGNGFDETRKIMVVK